jgi:hypothetical protein
MILLMFLAFLSFWIMMGNSEREPDWRLALIQAFILWGGYLILGTELLGAFQGITRLGLALLWVFPNLAGILWVWFWLKRGKVLRLPIVYHYDSWVGSILDALVVLILLITLVVAVVAPPNSNGALVFRMSRVAHWAQNQSLAHYPTGIEIQNSYSPGAEIVILNFYILDGGDRLANLAAWLGFAGSVAAAASLAKVLGAKMNGQRMAAIFSATLPVAITQATSSMNDIVVGFWVVSTVLMLLYYTRKSPKPLYLVLTALAAALAVVTKPTALIFLWPFALYMVVVLRQRLGLPKMLLWAVIAFAILGAINGGQFYRNQQTYGQFYRPVEMSSLSNDMRSWRVLVSNITRNAALHADLPFPRAENWLLSNLLRLHEYLDLDPADSRTTLGGAFYIPDLNTSEMTSSNPIHAAIIVFSFTVMVGMVVLGKEDPEILVYCGAIFFSLVLFCYMLKWQPSGGRLHLPFFILFAPLVAFLLDKLEKFQLETAIGVLLLIFAVPWLLQTEQRPVIPDLQRTYPISVFDEARTALYFATNPEDYAVYLQIADEITARGLTHIGLDLTPTSEEYPFWVLLGAPDPSLRIEWVTTSTASFAFVDRAYDPDAIICEACSTEKLLEYSETFSRIPFEGFDVLIKEKQ